MATNTIYRRNIYSEDLIKTLYIDSDLSHIKENLDASVNNGDAKDGDKGQQAVFDQRNGVRCIRISPDGRHLASGDRAGNIRVHELQFMDELCKVGRGKLHYRPEAERGNIHYLPEHAADDHNFYDNSSSPFLFLLCEFMNSLFIELN